MYTLYTDLNELYLQVEAGQLTKRHALNLMQDKLSSLKIGETGYAYLLSIDGTLLTHPYIRNANLLSYDHIRQQVQKKRGFIEYLWKNKHEDIERNKLIFMNYFGPWKIVITTSAYKDEFINFINEEAIGQKLAQFRYDVSGYSYILNGKGEFILHPFLKGKVESGRHLDNDVFMKNFTDKEEGEFSYSFINREGISEFKNAYFTRNRMLDWIIVSAVNDKEVNAKIQAYTQMFALFVLMLMLITFLLIRAIHKNSQLYQLAYFSNLDDIYNKATFRQHLEVCINNKHGYALTVKIQNFGRFNDSYSYDAGDELLVQLGKRICSLFPNADIYRISGSTFSVLIQSSQLELITRSACLLKQAIEQAYSIHDQERFIQVVPTVIDVSLGIETLTDFFTVLNASLYMAPRHQDPVFCISDLSQVEQMKQERDLERELKNAVAKQEIRPFYQGKIDLDSEQLIGCEALARWSHPERGFISPGMFIPIAEATDLIVGIDIAVAEQAIITVREWVKNGKVHSGFKMSLNLSVKTFENLDVVKEFAHMLEQYEVEGRYIEIEITESLFIRDFSQIQATMYRLKLLGISLSLDDFTAGHSSASTLIKLPLDIVKFDRSIIFENPSEKDASVGVYRSLVGMCKELSLVTVAEGIETQEQAIALREAGVDIAQGFYYSKPEPVHVFEQQFLCNVSSTT